MDFHSLRMTLSTMMAVYGMSQRSRQAQMRHSDPKLTEITYMDLTLLPIADELARVPAIPLGTTRAALGPGRGRDGGGGVVARLPAPADSGERGGQPGAVGGRAAGRASRRRRSA
ncbi:MAG: hypothetical protein IT435_17580 [Phycisphaerales bacterium]|nr:hypothetical protein [Phycisphaerales bacterium]